MTTCIADDRPLARKAHGCSLCLGRITPGERYMRQRNADSADIWTFKAHLLCVEVQNQIERDNGPFFSDEGSDPDEVAWYLGELLGGLLGRKWVD